MILLPILALVHLAFLPIYTRPSTTTPFQHVASSGSSSSLSVSHLPKVPLAYMAQPALTTQGERLEVDFWRSLREE